MSSDLFVPQALKDDTRYADVTAVKEALNQNADAEFTAVYGESKPAVQTAYYELTPFEKQDNLIVSAEGKTFESGLPFTIPYPEGTNAAGYRFVVSHLKSTGDVETVQHTEEETGLRVAPKTFSPFAVSYVADGTLAVTFVTGDYGTPPETQYVAPGDTATEPEAPTADYQRFDGWYLDPDYTIPFKFATPITVDTTLYAKWTHVHRLVHYTAKQPTCTQNGNIECYLCRGCGKYFEDDKATKEITDTSKILIKALGHTYQGGICKREYDKDGTIVKDPSFVPKITKGDGVTVNYGSAHELTANMNYATFQAFVLDNQTVGSQYYTVKEGSTVITLPATVINSLSAGKHTVQIKSLIGTASGSFTVASKSSGTSSGTVSGPKTGDESNVGLWCAAAVISLAGISVIAAHLVRSKKKKNNR